MSTTIYHVYETSPCHSDGYTHLVKSWTDPVKAAEQVYQLTAAHTRRQLIDEGVRKVRVEVDACYPLPARQPEKEIPRWPTGLGKHQITQEMRDERQAIYDYNARVHEENAAMYNKWQQEVVLPAIHAYLQFMEVPEDKYEKYYSAVYTEKTFYVEAGYLD